MTVEQIEAIAHQAVLEARRNGIVDDLKIMLIREAARHQAMRADKAIPKEVTKKKAPVKRTRKKVTKKTT